MFLQKYEEKQSLWIQDLTEDVFLTQLPSKVGIPDKLLFSQAISSYDILHTSMWYSILVTLYGMGKG